MFGNSGTPWRLRQIEEAGFGAAFVHLPAQRDGHHAGARGVDRIGQRLQRRIARRAKQHPAREGLAVERERVGGLGEVICIIWSPARRGGRRLLVIVRDRAWSCSLVCDCVNGWLGLARQRAQPPATGCTTSSLSPGCNARAACCVRATKSPFSATANGGRAPYAASASATVAPSGNDNGF